MPWAVLLNKTDQVLLWESRHSNKGRDVRQRRKAYSVSADNKYQEDQERCTRGWGGWGGGKGCGFTGVVWKGLSEGLTSQQGSDWGAGWGAGWSEGASKRDIRRDSAAGRGNSVSKDLESGVCSVGSRNSTEASTPGTEKVRGREGGRRRIGQGARSHSLRTGWPQREPQANSDSSCTRSAPCLWPPSTSLLG